MLIGISGPAGSGKDAAGNFLVEDFGFTKVALADPLKRLARDVYDFTDDQLWGPSQFRNAPDKRFPRPCRAGYDSGEKVYRKLHDGCPECQGAGVTYLSPREALQKLGTEWGRECYPNTWVDLCIRTARKLLDDPGARYTQKDGVYRLDNRTWEIADMPDTADLIASTSVRGVAVPDVRFRNEIKAIKGAGGKMIRVVRPGAGLVGGYATHVSETEQLEIPDSEFDIILHNNGTLEDLRTEVKGIFA